MPKNTNDKRVTVLTNLYVRAIVLIPDLAIYYDVCDRSATARIGALGNVALGGRDAEGYTSELRDIHHGLMKLIAGGSMEGAHDWELGKWVVKI